jgi:hypothetical protein
LGSGRALVRFGIEKLAGGRRMSSLGVPAAGGGCILNMQVTLSAPAAVYGNLSAASTTAQASAHPCCASVTVTATCHLDPTCRGHSLGFPDVASTESCTTAGDQGATKADSETPGPFSPSHQVFRTLRTLQSPETFYVWDQNESVYVSLALSLYLRSLSLYRPETSQICRQKMVPLSLTKP